MTAKLCIEVDENTVKSLVRQYLERQIGAELEDEDIIIETKSKQNYRSEWESASFRAKVDKIIE